MGSIVSAPDMYPEDSILIEDLVVSGNPTSTCSAARCWHLGIYMLLCMTVCFVMTASTHEQFNFSLLLFAHWAPCTLPLMQAGADTEGKAVQASGVRPA